MMPAHVTDHAVRRYAERALHLHVDETLEDPAALLALGDRGVDVEAVRRRIGDVCDLAAERGAVGVRVDGVRLILRGQAVVTALEKRCRPHYYYGDAA
jgi:non-canonical (house-cleaning) NTP pyrophosphatase